MWRGVLFAFVFATACGRSQANRTHGLISANPQSINFGSHAGGERAVSTVTLTNDGTVVLNIASTTRIVGDARGAFSASAVPSTLLPGASTTVQLTYLAPAAVGADGASLEVDSDADNAPQLLIALSGSSTGCSGACGTDSGAPGDGGGSDSGAVDSGSPDAGPTDAGLWQIPFLPSDFDVSADGAIVAVGSDGGDLDALCFNPDGTVARPAFVLGTFSRPTYQLFDIKVARARQTKQSAISWNISNFPVSPNDWQTWATFLDAACNQVGTPALLDPQNTIGINRYADVRMSDTGTSAFLYEAQSANAYRLIIDDADGGNIAAVSVGPGLCGNGALGRAIGMRRTTGELIAGCESGATKYYQRFTAAGAPVDAAMVAVPSLNLLTGPWSLFLLIEYDDSGAVAFSADVAYTTTDAHEVAFFLPGMVDAGAVGPFGARENNDRILVTSNGDFVTPITNGVIARQRFHPDGGLVSQGSNPGTVRLDGADNVYWLTGRRILKNPFPL